MNSVTSRRAKSSGAASTAPKATRASSNSHHRLAGIPRKRMGVEIMLRRTDRGGIDTDPRVAAGSTANEYQSRCPPAYSGATSTNSPEDRGAETANSYSIRSGIQAGWSGDGANEVVY